MPDEIPHLIEKIEVETDRQKLFNWYRNGHDKEQPSIMAAALKRAIQLRAAGFDPEDEFENAVFHALAGYEVALSINNNTRRVAANRTRGLLKRLGTQDALEFLVDVGREPVGLQLLTSMQLAEFTFESVIVSFPHRFTVDQVDEANRRLNEILDNRPSDFIYPQIKRNLF